MKQNEVLIRLQNIFDKLFIEQITVTPELSAKDVEEWDSLIQVSLMVAVEKEFGIRFRVGEVEATRNIGEFADLIIRRISS